MKEKITEKKEDEEIKTLQYENFIRMYYYEALRHERPTMERMFEKSVKNVVQRIHWMLEDHPLVLTKEYSKEELHMGNADAALAGYVKNFFYKMDKYLFKSAEFDAASGFRDINNFIMMIHERLRLHMGEEFFGLSENDLAALNYIDTHKPLEQQSEIIYRKLSEIREKDL